LTPPKYHDFICWLAFVISPNIPFYQLTVLNRGYMNVLGYISIYASTIYAATLILGATCSIGSNSTFVAIKYQNYGVFVATTLLTFSMTCVPTARLNKLNISYMFIQFATLLALIIALAAGTPSEL